MPVTPAQCQALLDTEITARDQAFTLIDRRLQAQAQRNAVTGKLQPITFGPAQGLPASPSARLLLAIQNAYQPAWTVTYDAPSDTLTFTEP